MQDGDSAARFRFHLCGRYFSSLRMTLCREREALM
jgi:hypothetical protein